jgi:uncharacterized protein (TIGR02145 family)
MKAKLILLFIGLSAILFSCKKDKPIGPQYGSVTDVDGNVYKTIKIGDQVWMAENLRVTHYNTGTTQQDEIPLVSDPGDWENFGFLATGAYCYFDNDPANLAKYGALYNWYAVNTGKLAPAGWHVPTDADWQKLQDFLIANGYNYDGTTSGNKIGKSLAINTGWDADATVGNVGNDQASNNKSKFSALPAGYRSPLGSFGLIGYGAYWWSYNNAAKSNWGIEAIGMNLASGFGGANLGLSIRCVKD